MSTTTKKRNPARRSGPVRWELGRAGGLELLKAPALARLDWLVHGFSTRQGGTSELKGAHVLNLAFTDWDSRERVIANRNKFLRAIGADTMRVVTLKQIHSDLSYLIDRSHTGANIRPEGDALFTREPGILLAVQTADCLPILLADTRRRAVAAIHSGWRGTLRRIAQKTLGRMRMEFGTRPEDVTAALGPGIGRCCYEVGSDVACEFHAQFPEAEEWFDGPFHALTAGRDDPNWLPWLMMRPPGHPPATPRANLDLIAANRAILLEAGVPARQISVSGFCTACRNDILFSYRRERATGRLWGAIGLANPVG
jgi:purine-nucleoside/S-methyl-5'-thioadenosine phosphorylase / adenosine deaminase